MEKSEMERRKLRAAYLSVTSNTSLVIGKVVVGLTMSSVAVLSEAIHSGIDLLAAILATIAIHHSTRPADKSHEYGHGKFEDLSGTVEAILILIAAIIIVYESVRRIIAMEEITQPPLGVAMMGASVVVNVVVSRHLFKVARETESVALEADALHLSTDVWTSAGVMMALVVIWVTEWHWVDPVVAVSVAVLIGWAAYRLTRRTLGDLVDAPLPPENVEVIKTVLLDHEGMHIGWHQLRTRRAGPDRHIDLHLHFKPSMKVSEAHEIAHHIQDEIEAELPRSHVLIHLEPCEGVCEACEEVCEDRKPGGEGD
jgi:cation diffusion facilitator family transporter